MVFRYLVRDLQKPVISLSDRQLIILIFRIH